MRNICLATCSLLRQSRSHIKYYNYPPVDFIFRDELVGVKPPVDRTEDDFDPGAMFHIVGAYSFLR